MTRYIIYNRVSTKKQLTENQRAACFELYEKVKQDGDTLFEFDERDKTTHLPMDRRTKLMEMLEFCKKGDVLIVTKADRLARHPQELINIWFELKKKGVLVRSLFETELNDFNITLYAFIAYAEREFVSKRTKEDLKQRKLKGERYGRVPFGYKLDENILQTHRPLARSFEKPYKLIPHEKEQEAIKIMVNLYNDGQSYGAIERELLAQGHKTRTGNPISKRQVYNFLKRRPEETPIVQEMAMTH